MVVGKAVLVANNIRLIDRYRGAPLTQPILNKALFYTLVVLVVTRCASDRFERRG